MSLLAFVTTLILTLATSGFVGQMSARADSRARAQTAADAAALAAVAEWAPYGGGSPYAAALHFAQLNDGDLRRCECDSGTSTVEVEVEVDGVSATARAFVDVTLLMPAPGAGGGNGGLDPRLQAALDRLLAAAEGRVWLESGYRSAETQRVLWEDALARYGDAEIADDWVARPGTSMHERGLAVDLTGDVEYAASMVEQLGLPLVRPMSWEPWHFQLDP